MLSDIEIRAELHLEEPTEELLDWAKTNIREDPDTKCQQIDELRDMIYSKGECTSIRTDDAFLLRFLRSRKFSVEAAYKTFVNYHVFREENPQFYENIGFDLLEKVGQSDLINVPPYLDQAGRKIVLFKWGKWSPENTTVDEVLAASLLIQEIGILEPKTQILGAVVILDFSGLGIQQALYLTPSVARKILQLVVTSVPIRIEALHVMNNSWVFEIIYNVFKPFLHDKIIEKVYFHGSDMESLNKYMDPKHLPATYGGSHPDYDYREWLDWIRKNDFVKKELMTLGYKMT